MSSSEVQDDDRRRRRRKGIILATFLQGGLLSSAFVCVGQGERERKCVFGCLCMLVRERMIRGKSNPYSLHLKLCCERLCQPPYQSQMTRLKCKNGFQIIARVLKRLGLFCTEIRCIIMMAMRMMTIGCK